MRRIAALRALAFVVFASATVFACGDAAGRGQPPSSTSIPVDPSSIEPEERVPPTAGPQPTIPSDPRISAAVVESMLPSAAETSAILGVGAGGWILEPGMGALVDMDLARLNVKQAGVTASWSVGWKLTTPVSGAPADSVGLTLVFHRTPEGAGRTYQHIHSVTGAQDEHDLEGIADLAAITTALPSDVPFAWSLMSVREHNVAVMVSVMHSRDRDARAALREFARTLALGIDEFVRSQGPTVAPTPTPTSVPIEEGEFVPSDPRITEEVVEGILPSPADTSATLELAPGAWTIEPLEPWRGWSAWFQPAPLTPTAGAIPEGIGVTLFFRGTTEEAEEWFRYACCGENPAEPLGDERGTIADAALMQTFGSSATITIRQGTVIAQVSMQHGAERDVSAGLRAFAQMLALGIDEFLRSQGP